MNADASSLALKLNDVETTIEVLGRIDDAFLGSNVEAVTLSGSSVLLTRLLTERPYAITGDCLTRSSWSRSTPFQVRVGDLVMRPVEDCDAQAFIRMLQDKDVARMLVNLDHPIHETAAMRWIRQRKFTGRSGFQIGVFEESKLVGSVGISALSNALVYFLGTEVRGKGYARKIIRPFVDYAMARWCLPRVFAGVFCDNPASRHILETSGFTVTGQGQIKSLARPEPAPFWEMHYDRQR